MQSRPTAISYVPNALNVLDARASALPRSAFLPRPATMSPALVAAFAAPAPLQPASRPTTRIASRAARCTASRQDGDAQPAQPAQPGASRRAFLRQAAAAVGSAAALAGPLLGAAGPAAALSKKRIMAKAGPAVTLDNGIVYRDITIGKGYVPRDGDTVAIHYSLFYNDLEVESSRESQGLAASPIGFTFGTVSGPGAIMPGINLGMDGMKVGGLRLISVPPKLAYGAKGKMPLVPPDSTVDFAVSLLSCKRAGTNPNSMINPKAQAY